VPQRLDVDQNWGIRQEYALDYVHAGLAPAAGIARTPSFVLCYSANVRARWLCVPMRRERKTWVAFSETSMARRFLGG
jgi:hypothetical protein